MEKGEDVKDYGVTEVASVVVVTDKGSGQPVGLDLVMHESVQTSEEAVQVMQHLAGNVQQLGWCLNVLKRHAMTVGGTDGGDATDPTGGDRASA